MNVSFEGVGRLAVTVPNENAVAGQLCKLNAEGMCARCQAGEHFVGLVEAVEGDSAALQIAGFATVKFTGSEPVVGFNKFISNGNGGVKYDASAGKEYLVVAVDSGRSTITLKL